jgi:2-furoate---CoA ligase
VLDLGRTLVAAVERDPDARAVVDGPLRLNYGQWFERVRHVMGGLAALGLGRGDRLITALQNRWEMAALHWACQMMGIVFVPVNWRVKAEELDYYLDDTQAGALAFQDVSADAAGRSKAAQQVTRIAVGEKTGNEECSFSDLLAAAPADGSPRAGAEDVSIMLYTAGTTGQPKGVPRRHRAERAAALAHVAQNLYGYGESTLGVMPLYHTMGVRSLLSMVLVNGCFVCLARFDPGAALELIWRERITNLYLVPTLYHDILAHEAFEDSDISSVRKLAFAGAPMTEGLVRRLVDAFHPELFVNHYGSSEIYTFSINQNTPAKPGSAGKAGVNTPIRVVRHDSTDPNDRAATGEEGQIIASLEGDESFEGYWRRPEANARALHGGWYFTGDTGYFDAEGDLFVTGRVDDMIITGGENVQPTEVENVLSLHPAVAEVAVAGMPDERLGQRVTAFVRRLGAVDAEALDRYCRESHLANFKRPRQYLFVAGIPKSPVGKILRRLLIADQYELEDPAKHKG